MIIFKVGEYANGYGFPKFLRQVNLEGGIVRFRTIPLKILSCALTIGSGGSAGVEGPIAQVGGAVGSQVGQFFRVSGSRMKVFIAAGCAGGVAAMPWLSRVLLSPLQGAGRGNVNAERIKWMVQPNIKFVIRRIFKRQHTKRRS